MLEQRKTPLSTELGTSINSLTSQASSKLGMHWMTLIRIVYLLFKTSGSKHHRGFSNATCIAFPYFCEVNEVLNAKVPKDGSEKKAKDPSIRERQRAFVKKYGKRFQGLLFVLSGSFFVSVTSATTYLNFELSHSFETLQSSMLNTRTIT